MAWTRNLSAPIALTDGRTLETLSQVREIMLSLPAFQRHGIIWSLIAKRLDEAASDNAAVSEVQGMLLHGLKAAGLL
jgi:hypothetical protein